MTIIPITKLRNFYESLSKLSLSTKTQLEIVKDIGRKENPKKLISLYKESNRYFAEEYENIKESFLPNDLNHRRSLPNKVETISRTQDAISVLQKIQKRKNKIEVGDSAYDFIYIEREVPTYRITRTRSVKGKKSGAGGIDFIGFNCKNSFPILGEIKIKSDQNPFYALIQLMTYLAELSTPNQIARINKYKLFGKIPDLTHETSFYLYILLAFTNISHIKEELLSKTQKLAEELEKPHIQEIEKIVFLKMDPETKEITII